MTINRERGKKKEEEEEEEEEERQEKNNDFFPQRDGAAGILENANLHNTWVQLFLQNFTIRTTQNNNKISAQPIACLSGTVQT